MTGIREALRQLKGNTWVKVPYLPAIEEYIETGDRKWLEGIAPVTRQDAHWGDYLVVAFRPIEQWQDEDRRIAHVLAAAGLECDVWGWLNGAIRQEKEGQDLHAIVARELEVGRKQATRLARDTMARVTNLVNAAKPNSAGRFLLAQSDDVLCQSARAISKDWRRVGAGDVAELLLMFAPGRVDAVAEDFLLCDGGNSITLPVVQALLRHDKKRYAPVIAKVMKRCKDASHAFYVGRALYEALPETFGEVAFDAARGTLAGPAECNNHDEAGVFMIRAFGRKALPDILEYFQKSREADHDAIAILKAAAAAFKMDILPAVLKVLDRCHKREVELSKHDPGNYDTRWKRERNSQVMYAAVEQLIVINDGSQDELIQREIEAGLAGSEAGGVIACLSLAEKWDIQRIIEKVWGLLEHKSKPVRGVAAWMLARRGDEAAKRAQSLLTHKKGDVRMAAAFLLASVNTPAALEILESRLDKEQNDDVRDQMLLGLEEAWAKQGRKVGRKDVEKRIRRAAEKLEEPVAKWAKAEKLPPLHWADGGKVNQQGVSYLLYRQSRAREMRPDVEAKAVYELIDRKSSGDFAKALLEAFLSSKQEAGDRWAMTAACKLGDNRLVPMLSGQIRQWVDANRGKLAEYAVQALALLGTDAALLTVDAMAIRYRSKMKNVGKAAAEAFAGAAEALGITPEELGDRVVPWLGFEVGKPRIIESCGGKFEVSIGMDFKLAYKDLGKNKLVKSLPKNCPAEVLAELKEVSGTLREAVKSQLLRLENLLVRQRRWAVARWRELFLSHPLLLPFAVRMVWGHYDESGKLLGLFRGLEDRTLTTASDEAYELGERGQVGMVHPLELDEATRQAWQNHLADYEIDPPFPQLQRQVVRVGEGDVDRKTYADLSGRTLNAMTFKGRAERLGWHRGSVCDGGGITSYVKSFPTAGVDVILGVEDFYIGIDMYSDMRLGDVMFVGTGSVTFGSCTYDEPSKEDDPRVLTFGQVPPIVFSEAMGDLRAIAGAKDEEAMEVV